MTALSQVRGADDLARKAAYAAYIVRDFQQKAGGQPFDNRNLVYVGTEDDAALNRGVERYAGDPMAAQYLMQFFTPTGNLLRPLMEVHTIYDRLIPAFTDEWYSNQVMRQGHEDNFVLQYVEENGHCNFTPSGTGDSVRRVAELAARWQAAGIWIDALTATCEGRQIERVGMRTGQQELSKRQTIARECISPPPPISFLDNAVCAV